MTTPNPTYRIRRFCSNETHPDHRRVINRGLTLEQAQAHCRDPKTNGTDADRGQWFDGYDEETAAEMSETTLLVRRMLKRDMRDGSRVVAILEMRRALPGERFAPSGLSPAFSLTGEVFERHGSQVGSTRERRYRKLLAEGGNYGPASEPDTSGACHDEILRAFPELAQFAAMHLSDPETGEPMHAEANGWYWYAGSREDLRASEGYTGFDAQRPYLQRIREQRSAEEIAADEQRCYESACRTLRVSEIPRDLDQEGFSAFVNAQRERWNREAAEARAYIESLPEGDE